MRSQAQIHFALIAAIERMGQLMQLVAEQTLMQAGRQQRVHAAKSGVPQIGRYRRQPPARGSAKRPWKPANTLPNLRQPGVAIVAAKDLIAAISGESNRHLPARQLREQ